MNYYYKSIPSEEMSDFEEFYRWIAGELLENSYIAELGIADGRGIITMASLMSHAGKPCTIWAVDDYSYGGDYQRKVVADNIRNSGETSIEIQDMSTLEAACRCQDEQFSFVFIDSSHLYEHTKAEIRLWIHKVQMGGILAGHDYGDNPQVKTAVDELIPPGYLHLTNTTHGHGVWWIIKTADFHLLK